MIWTIILACEPGSALVVGTDIEEDTAMINDQDGDGYEASEDCDDTNAAINPGAEEVCDALDNDCDEEIDEEDICPCEYASFEGKGYFFCEEAIIWGEAREECETLREGYQLLSINDESENIWIHEREVVASSEAFWWIGLNDIDEEGEFSWVNGDEVFYTSWHDGEPNDSNGEDCTELKRFNNTNWNDVTCQANNYFICEGPR